MSKTNKIKRRNPFVFLVLVIILSITVVTSIYAIINYNLYNDAVKKEEVNKIQKEIIESATYVNNTLASIKNMGMSMAYSWDIIKYDTTDQEDYEQRNKIIGTLRNNYNAHSYIESIYAVYRKHDVVLTSQEGWFSCDEFYDKYVLDYDSLVKDLAGVEYTPVREVTDSIGNKSRVVSYFKELLYDDNKEKSYIIININADKLLDIMDTQTWEDSHDVMVLDKYGKVVIDNTNGLIKESLNSEDMKNIMLDNTALYKKINGKDVLINSWKSGNNGWVYVRIKNIEDMNRPIVWLKNTAFFLFAMAIITIIILMATLWIKLFHPYFKLVDKVSLAQKVNAHESNEGIGFEYIGNSLDWIIKANMTMKDAYLESILVGGRAYDKNESDMHDQFDFDNYIVMVFSAFNSMNYSTAAKDRGIIQEMITESLTNTGNFEKDYRFIKLYGADMALIINNINMLNYQEILIKVKNLMPQVNDICSENWAVGTSAVHIDIETLHEAYTEANEALKLRYFKYHEIFFDYEETSNITQHFYQLDNIMMDVFSNNLMSLNFQGAKGVLNNIVRDIVQKSQTAYYYNIYNVFMQLFDAIVTAMRNNGMAVAHLFNSRENIEFLHNNCKTLKQEFMSLNNIFDQAENYINEHNKNATKKSLAQRMIEYVEDNYNKGVTLSSMAFEFNMTESYLSNQFKEKVGVSFVKYVTKLRIDKAKEMLEHDSDIKISDIADSLDMGNVQSFIRVFKKYEGITPGQYREKFFESNKTV